MTLTEIAALLREFRSKTNTIRGQPVGAIELRISDENANVVLYADFGSSPQHLVKQLTGKQPRWAMTGGLTEHEVIDVLRGKTDAVWVFDDE